MPCAGIIHDHGELVGEDAVGAEQDEVATGFIERFADVSTEAIGEFDQ